jgi:hypothetical protein
MKIKKINRDKQFNLMVDINKKINLKIVKYKLKIEMVVKVIKIFKF